jgi:hypothetical protein
MTAYTTMESPVGELLLAGQDSPGALLPIDKGDLFSII